MKEKKKNVEVAAGESLREMSLMGCEEVLKNSGEGNYTERKTNQ